MQMRPVLCAHCPGWVGGKSVSGDTGLRDVGRYSHKLVPARQSSALGWFWTLDIFLTTSHGRNTSPPHHDESGGWWLVTR